MFALAVSTKSALFFTTGNEGKIYRGDYITQSVSGIVSEKEYPNRVLALSKDEQYLVNGTDSTRIEIYNLKNPNSKPTLVAGHRGFINDIKFLPDNSGFVSASGDKTLRFTNHLNGQSKQLISLPFELKAIDISADGNFLAGVSSSGKLILMNIKTNTYSDIRDESPNRVLSVAFHPTKNLIAFGVEMAKEKKGTVKIYDLDSKRIIKELSGHKAGISDLEFSPDGQLLASAGLDSKLQMWVVEHVNDLPIEMENNNGYVWDIAFSKDSNYLLAASNNGEIRVWPTDPKMLAEKICPSLSRNMTQEEWSIYVGGTIPYESTCITLQSKRNH
jgi:WD40 repeat protein